MNTPQPTASRLTTRTAISSASLGTQAWQDAAAWTTAFRAASVRVPDGHAAQGPARCRDAIERHARVGLAKHLRSYVKPCRRCPWADTAGRRQTSDPSTSDARRVNPIEDRTCV